MSDTVWTAQKSVNGKVTVAVVTTPGGRFRVTDRGIIDGLRTVDVYDMDNQLNWETTVPDGEYAMERALEFVRRNHGIHPS